jgi:hypothetical protein
LEELRKIILGLYKNDENFGSKILPGVELVAFEERIKSSNSLLYHMQITIKIKRINLSNPTLEQICRKNIRQYMRKSDITNSLKKLNFPTKLKKYLIYKHDNPEKNNQTFESQDNYQKKSRK